MRKCGWYTETTIITIFCLSKGQIATTNFEQFHMDIQAADLYYFFRKVMEKHRWKESLGRKAFGRPIAESSRLQKQRRNIWHYVFLIRKNSGRSANSYYHSNKAWMLGKECGKTADLRGTDAGENARL